MTPRTNPFRAQRIDALGYRLHDTTWEELLARLAQLKFRGAITGSHGHGKSTLLDALAPRLQAQGWRIHRLRLNSSRRALSRPEWELLSTLGRADFVLLDGAEQLPYFAWRKFILRTVPLGGLLITSHTGGRLPTLYRCETSARLLSDLIQELTGDFSGVEEPDFTARVLFERHSGNLREALRALYDEYSAQ